jgi:hypothetical protein
VGHIFPFESAHMYLLLAYIGLVNSTLNSAVFFVLIAHSAFYFSASKIETRSSYTRANLLEIDEITKWQSHH